MMHHHEPTPFNLYDAPPAPATRPTANDYVIAGRALLVLFVFLVLFAFAMWRICQAQDTPYPKFDTLPRAGLVAGCSPRG
jgi:hypothetical protein